MALSEDKPPYRWRTQKVFLSSTFRDFHAERDYLVKFVFPEIRAWCGRYRIHLVDIDLRWGITDDQSKNGRTLDLCLESVDECRPFFLALIGSRYGWTPGKEDVPPHTVAAFPDLAPALERAESVTHLEIRHAVLGPLRRLDDAGTPAHTFFYLRDRAALPDPTRVTTWTDDNRQQFLEAFFDAGAPEKSERLVELKRTIEDLVRPRDGVDHLGRITSYRPEWDSTLPNPEDPRLSGRFTVGSLRAFGTRVKRHLIVAISRQYRVRVRALIAQRQNPTLADDSEHDLQESFAAERAEADFHIKRPTLLAELRGYVLGDSRKIQAVTGAPGCGKSTLLAALYSELRPMPDSAGASLVVPHFVGASPGSTALPTILFRLCGILKTRFNLRDEIPLDPLRLRATFLEFLSKCTVPTVFIIDGLNQLDDFDDAHDLRWLPTELPPLVKVVASTLPGRTADALSAKTDSWLTVGDLLPEERRTLITRLPSIFAKTLDDEQIEALLAKPGTRNPLYLKIALEELRVFGGFGARGELLASHIEKLPTTLEGILDFLLARFERDHQEQPGLVESVFCLLACSRRGLTERELADLLPQDKEKRHQILLRQIRDYLQHRGEVIDFSHRSLAKAVQTKWLLGQDHAGSKAVRWHRKLADFFEMQPTLLPDGAPNRRKAEELARQATWASASEGVGPLVRTLTDLEWVEAKIRADMILDLQEDYRLYLTVAPTSAEQVMAFARFVYAASHLLSKHGHGVGFVRQQAYNHAAGGPVATAAKEALERPRTTALAGSVLLLDVAPPPFEPRPASVRVLWGHTAQGNADTPMKVTSLDATPDLARVVSTHGFVIQVWDPQAGTPVQTLRCPEGGLDHVLVTTDGTKVLSYGDYREDLRLWDIPSGRCLFARRGDHGNAVVAAAITPDGRTAVSAHRNGVVRLWSLPEGSCLAELGRHKNAPSGLVMNVLGTIAVSRDLDGHIRVWDLPTRRCQHEIPVKWGSGGHVALTPDGTMAAFVEGWELKLLDVATGVARTLPGRAAASALAVAPGGGKVVSGTADGEIVIWDVDGNARISSTGRHTANITALKIASSGKVAISGSWDATVRIWDLQNGNCLRTLRGHSDVVTAVCLAADARGAASASWDGSVRMWDVESRGAESKEEDGESLTYGAVYTLPDESAFLSYGSRTRGFSMQFWDAAKGLPLEATDFPKSQRLIRFDRRHLVATGIDREVTSARLGPGAPPNVVSKAVQGDLLAISPDGRRAVVRVKGPDIPYKGPSTISTGMGTVTLGSNATTPTSRLEVWDLLDARTERVLDEFRGEPGGSMVITPDGRSALVAFGGYPLRAYDLESGARSDLLEASSWLFMASDGSTIVSDDGAIWRRTRNSHDRVAVAENLRGAYSTSVWASPDERFLVVARRGAGLSVVDLATGAATEVLEGMADPKGASVSCNGRVVVAYFADNSVAVWVRDRVKRGVYAVNETIVSCACTATRVAVVTRRRVYILRIFK